MQASAPAPLGCSAPTATPSAVKLDVLYPFGMKHGLQEIHHSMIFELDFPAMFDYRINRDILSPAGSMLESGVPTCVQRNPAGIATGCVNLNDMFVKM